MSPRPAPARAPRLRGALSAALIALCCLFVPLGALSVWAAYGLADTGRYVRTMAPLAGDPAVRDAVADTVGEQVTHRFDGTQDMMGPFVRDAVRSFTQTDAFRAGWDAANRAVHGAVLHALRDDERPRTGPVTVDLAPVTTRIRDQLADENVPLARRIPVRHTEVAVLAPGDLDRLRKGYDVLEVAALWLPVSAVAFAVTGIAVATCRRRALTATALGTALGGALLAAAVAIGRRLTLADLPPSVSRPAAGAVYDALTATLRTASWLLVTLGLAVALTTWLTGRHGHRPSPDAPTAAAPRPTTRAEA
ncbi:hypothetical protein ACIP2X_21275 [Streptomyces sp. NPDC089424]|uniref:hypothetical protein n=1 Tax=Streptomyces sp. NPDC089424 TaxID=3365917 RepID=UPI0038189FB7